MNGSNIILFDFAATATLTMLALLATSMELDDPSLSAILPKPR